MQSISISFVLIFVCCAACYRVPFTDQDWAIATDKAKTFVSALTLEEKVSLATGTGWQKGPCVGNIGNISRVGFSGLCLQDAPTGVRYTYNVSVFPPAINVATTWNRTQMYERGAAMGREFRGKGIHVALGPMMNIGRVAAGGRNWEGFGADPYLQGVAGYESILGIQDQGVIACAKHYIGNEQEHFRETGTSNIGERALHEIYQWPFMRAVQAGVGSVMCAYNKVNGTYACQNDRNINQILKGKFGFRGFVMSDWVATMSGPPSAIAGLDMNMPGNLNWGTTQSYWGSALVTAVKTNQVPLARVTDMGIRIMTSFYLLKQDNGFPAVNFDSWDTTKGTHANVQADHASLIRKIGADSNVLLKNNGILPFTSNLAQNGAQYTFAIIGDDAGANPAGPNACEDRGCDTGTLAIGWGSGTANFPYLITPLEGITNRATSNSQTVVSYLGDTDYTAAQAAAASAAVAVVFANSNSGEYYITVEGNQGDRTNLDLWHGTASLIQAVASVNSRTVVVIHAVGPVLMPWIDHPNISAVVLAGLPGQESGNSLADVLFGDVNPSGKLVYTIAKNRADYPADVIYNSQTVNYNEGLLIDHRWFDQRNITPQFEFGFGLSYTTFDYSNLVITPVSGGGYAPRIGTLPSEETLYSISATIRNTGSVAGEEVVQLYLTLPTSAGAPPKALRGFDKVWVGVGGTATAQFKLSFLEIAFYDVASASWTAPRGTFTISVGASSKDIRLVGTFVV